MWRFCWGCLRIHRLSQKRSERCAALSSLLLLTSLDKAGQTATAAVVSYVSADAKAAGKQMVGMPTHITVAGLPGDKENAFSFVEKQLVASEPADADKANLVYGFGGSRYMFADGKMVADV